MLVLVPLMLATQHRHVSASSSCNQGSQQLLLQLLLRQLQVRASLQQLLVAGVAGRGGQQPRLNRQLLTQQLCIRPAGASAQSVLMLQQQSPVLPCNLVSWLPDMALHRCSLPKFSLYP
jgi:hypothetical protein